MARVRVEVDFDLETDIWLDQDCVGKSIRFKRDGYDIELRLPPFHIDDHASVTVDSLRLIDGFEGSSYNINKPFEFQVGTRKFRICVFEEVEEIDRSRFEVEVSKEARDLLLSHQQKCRKLAERVAIEFLDYLRQAGQHWLGSMGSISNSVQPHSTTYDDATDFRYKYGHAHVTAEARPKAATLTEKTLRNLTDTLSASQSVPLPEAFLSDAAHFLAAGKRHKAQSDLQRAVLLAAIACELKVKETLRGKVFAAGLPLVETLISSPRDFSMSAAGLFDKAMKAATGRSLREDNNQLYKAIADSPQKDALFQNRNAIAHSGAIISLEAAQKNIQAAREVFIWLDELPVLQCPSAN